MAIELNHIIIPSTDKKAGAAFLAEVLGLESPSTFGHFVTVQTANGVSLDYDDRDEVVSQHCAFTVDEAEFDEIFARVTALGIRYFADPGHRSAGEINRRRGGRGFYFDDPDGHNMEVLTQAPTT